MMSIISAECIGKITTCFFIFLFTLLEYGVVECLCHLFYELIIYWDHAMIKLCVKYECLEAPSFSEIFVVCVKHVL